jgi:hypothetical protein
MGRSVFAIAGMPGSARRALCGLFFGLVAAFIPSSASAQDAGDPVDVELVLAVDASWSMDFEEQLIQRDGYASAFRSPEVIETILGGGYAKVAVTYVEWAGWESQQVVVPWTLIDSEAAAHAFADSLIEGAPRHYRRTSISGAINFAANLFDGNGYEGMRRVIDISGDGANNQGVPVTDARDAAVAKGLTINGLPLMTNEPGRGFGYDIPQLDVYFSECVIGGGQAFVIPVRSWEEFPEAVRRKLVLELAGPGLPVHLAQATVEESGVASSDCLIGEKLWEQRRQNLMP